MKKVFALALALIVTMFAVCALGMTAFADDDPPAETDIPETTRHTTTVATTVAPATTTTKATTAAPITTTTKVVTTIDPTAKDDSPIVTNPVGVTAIDDGPETVAAKVVSAIPNTGSASGVAIAAVVALAAAGAVLVTARKKEED